MKRIRFRRLLLGLVFLLVLVPLGSEYNIANSQQRIVTFWTWLDPGANDPRAMAQTEIINNFMDKYPDIKVEVVSMPWQDIDKRVIMAAAVGRGPDVAKTDSVNLAEHVAAGSVLPLDEYVKDWPEEKKDDFLLWDGTIYNDQKMAFFHDSRIASMFVRTDLLRKINADIPKTWDELTDVCSKLISSNTTTYGAAFGLSRSGGASAVREWLFPMLWGAGGELWHSDRTAAI